MKTQHTPGPWAADKYGVITGGEYLCTTIAETPVVAWRSADQKKQSDQAMSNARLIAAAPDLLTACEAALASEPCVCAEIADTASAGSCLACVLFAAIAKARGGADA